MLRNLVGVKLIGVCVFFSAPAVVCSKPRIEVMREGAAVKEKFLHDRQKFLN